MTNGKLFGLALLGSASIVSTSLAEPVADGGRKFTTSMNGQQEVNAANPTGGAGDPDGSGTASVTINVGQQRVCWDIDVNNIAAPTRGHIHKAPALVNGPIVVTFFEAGNVDLNGCTDTTLDRELLTDIIQHPSDYYVNIHNADFPGGAIRGQLAKK